MIVINKNDYINSEILSKNLDKVIIKESKNLKNNLSKKSTFTFNIPIKYVSNTI
jgi:hypothetical protein